MLTSVAYFDDDELSRSVMDLLLRRLLNVPHVAVFPDGVDCVARLRALPVPPEVVLLDVHMHPLDGFAVLKLLRADPTLASARVVALTASVMNEEVQLLRQAGFDGIIGKPIDQNTFPDLLARVARGERVWRPT